MIRIGRMRRFKETKRPNEERAGNPKKTEVKVT